MSRVILRSKNSCTKQEKLFTLLFPFILQLERAGMVYSGIRGGLEGGFQEKSERISRPSEHPLARGKKRQNI